MCMLKSNTVFVPFEWTTYTVNMFFQVISFEPPVVHLFKRGNNSEILSFGGNIESSKKLSEQVLEFQTTAIAFVYNNPLIMSS